ncbi:thioesterase family protein [Pelagibius sp. Alg239-R121]|uniref:acyl-CoA thioesterase n=1 Tax=Pelagibius sp. Alg239-R121 TaxID=2993448 RepID=UPI0024A64996|nr:thioesterase family protein [Pelagibius sp. Alg239-R121]
MTQSSVETRADYPHFLQIPTRWMDNDIYGHVNNVVYYAYFDTVINTYLIERGGLDIHNGGVIGVCAESSCRYRASFVFPDVIEAGLRVAKLGGRSVTYEIGLFKQGADIAPSDQAAAEGRFVHVFVDRGSMKPVAIPEPLRAALKALER